MACRQCNGYGANVLYRFILPPAIIHVVRDQDHIRTYRLCNQFWTSYIAEATLGDLFERLLVHYDRGGNPPLSFYEIINGVTLWIFPMDYPLSRKLEI